MSLLCTRAAETTKKNKHRCLQASVIEKPGHTRWIYSADLSVFTRHTSHEAFVVKVLARDMVITNRSKGCVRPSY